MRTKAADTSIQPLSPAVWALAIAADWSASCFSRAARRGESDAVGAETWVEACCAWAESPVSRGEKARTPRHQTSSRWRVERKRISESLAGFMDWAAKASSRARRWLGFHAREEDLCSPWVLYTSDRLDVS